MSDLDEVIYDCVRFIINKGCSRIPIKKQEVIKYMTNLKKDMNNADKNDAMETVTSILNRVYGYKLVQINSKGTVQYILVLSDNSVESLHEPSSCKYHALLIAALSHIFMSGGSVKEEDMLKFLEKAGLMKNDDHVTKKVLTHQFTRELYLNYFKVGESDHSRFVFEWGERAKAEMPKNYLLKKVAEAFDRSPEYWCEQNKASQPVE